MLCRVQFGDRRLHRIVVDHSFVISFGKCRNAHGIAENRHLLFTRSEHLYSGRFGNFLTNIVPIKLKVNIFCLKNNKFVLFQSLIVYSGGIF